MFSVIDEIVCRMLKIGKGGPPEGAKKWSTLECSQLRENQAEGYGRNYKSGKRGTTLRPIVRTSFSVDSEVILRVVP